MGVYNQMCKFCGYLHAPDYSDVRETAQEWIETVCKGAKMESYQQGRRARLPGLVPRLVPRESGEHVPMPVCKFCGHVHSPDYSFVGEDEETCRLLSVARSTPREMPSVLHVKFKRVHGHAGNLTQAYRGDAGYDLELCEAATLHSGVWTNLRTGIVAAIPDGYWGHILSRSSTWRHLGIRVEPAIIDSSYRGELMVYACYSGPDEFTSVSVGQRLAQIVIVPMPNVEWVEQRDLPPGERGERGYGSSGQG